MVKEEQEDRCSKETTENDEELMEDGTTGPDVHPMLASETLMGTPGEAHQEPWVCWARTARGSENPGQFKSSHVWYVTIALKLFFYQRQGITKIELVTWDLDWVWIKVLLLMELVRVVALASFGMIL
jgi:hypothetical protein